MALQTIPIAATPNQSFSVVLGPHDVDLTLRTLRNTVYIDVVCDAVPIVAGRICTDRFPLAARAAQLGFPDLRLWFADLRGIDNPRWTELGTRFVLLADVADATALGAP